MCFRSGMKYLENGCLSFLSYGYILHNICMVPFGEVSCSVFSVSVPFTVPTTRLFGKGEHAPIFWCIGIGSDVFFGDDIGIFNHCR